MVWNLLKRNISAGQIAGYALANLVGLAIVLTAVCFYRDLRGTVADGSDSIVGTDYLIVSKPVPLLSIGAGGAGATTFSTEEIEQLRSQPWVEKLGVFESARFDVGAAIELGGRRMSTALFFEAIPDEFYDISLQDWTFDPEHPMVPIILSKDYLALYNFGFAAPRGFPQLSEELIGKVPITVSVAGNGRYGRFPARIVGFSSRLNTIAVPAQFLDWANDIYGNPEQLDEAPSRLIIQVNNPGNPDIERYFDEHGIEVAGDKANTSRAMFLMTLITSIVVAVGILITILAVFILMLSIYLLIQKSREKLRDLMLLGYSPGQVCVYYYRLVGLVNLGILIAGTAIAVLASTLWRPSLEAMGIGSAAFWPVILIGLAIMALITALNFLTIRRLVKYQ